MKSGRLMSALLLLQAQGRLSTREIAERLEVSQRTAHRDMESLCESGVPLVAHRGSQGGWELQKGWRTKVPGLDGAELQSLLMVQPSALGDRRLTAAAERAYSKLMASLPKDMRLQAEAMRIRLHIDPVGWNPTNDNLSVLPEVQDALARDCKLTFVYSLPNGESNIRTVDPLGLVCKQTVWYLIARTKKGMRTYRVSRMSDVIILALSFKRPARFDLAKYWKHASERLKEEKQRVTAVVALSPQGVSALRSWTVMTPVENESLGFALPDGWLPFEVSFESHDQARFVVLGLGSRAKALSPPTLCREIESEITQIAALTKTH